MSVVNAKFGGSFDGRTFIKTITLPFPPVPNITIDGLSYSYLSYESWKPKKLRTTLSGQISCNSGEVFCERCEELLKKNWEEVCG